LVLDWVDGSLGDPVDLSLKVVGWELGNDIGLVEGLWSSVSEESLVLSGSPGGEHVVSNGEGVLWVGIDLLVLSILLGEDVQSELVLLLGSVGDSVFREVLDESLLGEGKWSNVVAGVEAEVGSGGAEGVHENY
jgi:hypothetical protein